jgi:PAS domain S-box-containing protein
LIDFLRDIMENKLDTVSKNSLNEMLMDCSIDAIIAIDSDYTVIAWNNAAALMYNVPKKQALGKSLCKLIPGIEDDTETYTAINNALAGHKAFVPASKLYAHRRHSENHFIPLTDNDGGVIGAMNIVHDVAHRIKAERELQRLNEELEKQFRQLKATSDELASFTFITSNKIKEPIRNIYTGVEHLIKVEAGRLTDSGKATFRRMQTSLNRMDLLLDDILSVAQISTLEKSYTPVDLTELVKEVSVEIKNKFDTEPVIEISELCVINGHRNYLRMLFYNLLHNAVKFNESARPTVHVSCKKTVLNTEAFFAPDKEYYQVTIADNGIGFEEEDKEKMFTMFEKLHAGKFRGSGIGLTVARKIMDAHNGFITVESTPGKGSSFHCSFPVTE